ncbi:MAG TPA: DUF3857 and transglutaminase domain-containing protein, partial [Salinivirgaceae bacterium]|nr:DUF3857 and transglutaminase domain-containing protein [Salinivirgaceae bacterium]
MKKSPIPLLLIFLLLLGRFSLFSQHPYFTWSNAENLSKLYPKSPYVIAFDSLVSKVSETGLSVVERKTLYQVLTPEGASKLSSLTLDYDPLSAEITVMDMFIVRKTGEKESFFNSKVYDFAAPARMIYWGARQKMVEPGRLEPGDMVFIKYQRKGFTYALLADGDDDRFIPPMRGHFYDIVEFFDSYPIHCKSYTVILPKEKPFLYKTYNADFTVEIKEEGNLRKAQFVLKSITPIEKEPRRVADSDIAPKVIVTTTERWQDKSKWFYGVNENFGSFNSTPQIDQKVKEILEGAVDELDSISRLTRWVADEIRYSGISMGEGEGYTLHTGEMTFTDRCGVCKDKAGMLVTMLRSAGFQAYAAMTMAGSRIEDIPADQFNHSVTVVKRHDGSFLLLDPTWVPFVRELWSSREQQQNYLLGLPDGDILRETPISSAENHFLKINNSMKIDRKGNATGVLTLTAEG